MGGGRDRRRGRLARALASASLLTLFLPHAARAGGAWTGEIVPAELASRAMAEVSEVIEVPNVHGSLQLRERWRLGCRRGSMPLDDASPA